MNLIVNGAEAIGDEPGSVRVCTKAARVGVDEPVLVQSGALEPGEYVLLSVTDTGCGMTEEVRERLFEPFFTTKFTGRGLGLSAVLGIVRNHGGGVRVASSLGEGTTFEVYLPATPEAAEPLTEAAREEAPAARQGGPTCVLYAEDEPDLRTLGSEVLRDAGFRVYAAADGDEAIALFREHGSEIAVSVLDLAMPGSNGWEVMAAVRADSPRARVILMSGYGRAAAGGGGSPDAFLHKPFRLSELVGAVTRLIPGEAEAGRAGDATE